MANLDSRGELLLRMYDQMLNDINRHIMVVWQSIGLVIGAFAIFAFAEKKLIPIDIAVSIVLMLVFWFLAHLIDSAYWYNRNLVIIANIERQFLLKSDLRDIHYYFGKHRENNKMITHLRIQFVLGIGISVILILFHIITRVYPGIGGHWETFDLIRTIPYATILLAFFYLRSLIKYRNDCFSEFLSNSPGIEVDTEGIIFGKGHSFIN